MAFSTANPTAFQLVIFTNVETLPNDEINPLFETTIQATEEAIINAMVEAETMLPATRGHRTLTNNFDL